MPAPEPELAWRVCRIEALLPSCLEDRARSPRGLPGFPGRSGLTAGQWSVELGRNAAGRAAAKRSYLRRGPWSTGGTAVLDRMTKRVGYSVWAAAVSAAPPSLANKRRTASAPWPRAS